MITTFENFNNNLKFKVVYGEINNTEEYEDYYNTNPTTRIENIINNIFVKKSKKLFKRNKNSIEGYKNLMSEYSLFVAGATDKDIRKVLGPPSFKTDYEYDPYCWVIEYDDTRFFIFSAEGRGTSIECLMYTSKETIEKFVNEFMDLLKTDEERVKEYQQLLKDLQLMR